MLNKKIRVLMGLCLLALVQSSSANEMVLKLNATEAELNDYAVEFADCSAYYTISSEAMAASGYSGAIESARRYDDLGFKTFAISRLYAGLTNSVAGLKNSEELADNVTISRVQMFTKNQREQIGNSYSNLTILTNKYLESCNNFILQFDAIAEFLSAD